MKKIIKGLLLTSIFVLAIFVFAKESLGKTYLCINTKDRYNNCDDIGGSLWWFSDTNRTVNCIVGTQYGILCIEATESYYGTCNTLGCVGQKPVYYNNSFYRCETRDCTGGGGATATPAPPGGGGGCGTACTATADCQAGFTCIGTNVCWNDTKCSSGDPTATPIPTATPVPARPALCQSATISKTSLVPDDSLTITSTANTSNIETFTYGFYNLDNLYGPNNPKPIFFTADTHYIRSDSTTPPVTTNSITVTYDRLNKPDLNWNSQKPIKIQVNAYFTNSEGKFSAPDANCVVQFNISSAPTATPIPTATPVPGCLCNTDGSCASVCAFDKFAAPITYANPIKCSLSDSLFPTPPSDKNSWCQRNMRTKGDADGNGTINNMDYFYYISAVVGGKIPVTVNPDFDGDGAVSNLDREIVIKTLNP